MSAWPKLIADRTEHRTEARRVPQTLEPLQTSLTLADRLVRVLDAIVLAPAAEMGNGRHHDGFRRCVARQPIGHEGARHHVQSLQEFAQEALRGVRVSAALNQDVKNLAGVIDGPPQPAALSIDHQTEFIQVPDVGAYPSRAPQSSGVLRAKPHRPEADGFVRDLNPSSEHQLGDVPQAQPETVVEPHATTDGLRREAMAFVECWSDRRLRHDGIRADHTRLDNAATPKTARSPARRWAGRWRS
jgi:hypothetical protein